MVSNSGSVKCRSLPAPQNAAQPGGRTEAAMAARLSGILQADKQGNCAISRYGQSNCASTSTFTFPFITFEIGQPSFVASAIFWNVG